MPRGRFSVIPPAEFIHLYKTLGPRRMARQTKMSVQTISERRRRLEAQFGRITAPSECPTDNHYMPSPERRHYDCLNGYVIVGSDAHIIPGALTTGQRAFLKFIKELKPRVVIANGDIMDFPSISRHDPLQWENTPPVIQELEAAQKFMRAVEDAAPGNCKLSWPAGNHDARFQARLAKVAPEYAGVNGTRLKDHFSPKWEPCYSAWINDDVVVKHRLSGGVGALRQNVLKTRKHTVTGHLHAQHVWPVTSYPSKRGETNQTLYGVDAGMLGDPNAQSFSYVEDNPLDWRAGFVVLKFINGVLLEPMCVNVFDRKRVQYRGELIDV